MKKLLILLLSLLVSCSVSEEQSDIINLDALLEIRPVQLFEIDQVNDIYFNHLNYSTEVSAEGDVFLNDREEAIMIKISNNGELLNIIASKGRGPGEIGDILSMKIDIHGGIHIYDQQNEKAVYYEPNNYEPEEFRIRAETGNRINSILPLNVNNKYLTVERNLNAMLDATAEPMNLLSIYDKTDQKKVRSHKFPDAGYARLIVDDSVMGGALVPYGPRFLFDTSTEKDRIYVSWSESNQVAELNSNLDTLRTIDLKLERVPISNIEMMEIENEFSNHHPNQIKSVKDNLPDFKMSYDNMLVDHKNRIWLKLTRWSENDQEWLIISNEGEPLQRVLLPKEGMLTHVSEYHIGFREDDHIFSLYETID